MHNFAYYIMLKDKVLFFFRAQKMMYLGRELDKGCIATLTINKGR